MSTPVYLNELGLVCNLGNTHEATLNALLAGSTEGMVATDAYSPGRKLVCGAIQTPLPEFTGQAATDTRMHGRNNRLLLEALRQIRPAVDAAISRFGKSRVGIMLGSSTSSIGDAEAPFFERAQSGSFPPGFHYARLEAGLPSEFLAAELDLDGMAFTLSTACSSSAKALASARRHLNAGTCDAVIAGGADMLCQFTTAGFSALEALSPEQTLPFSRNRRGINIGEAAVLFLVSREKGPVQLLGCGESSDAYNVSAPEPEGKGAAEAMRLALSDAGLGPDQIDYLNLHGTGTQHNDSMESKAAARVLGPSTPCSSTKPLTGHTLGTAGALEAAFCWLMLSPGNNEGRLPPHVFDGQQDPNLDAIHLVKAGEKLGRPLKAVMSNSFGFGGSNATLILGTAE